MHALRPQLERAARRRGLTTEQAQDVVSEALLRAADATGLDPARLHAWLHVVTRRLVVDELRRGVSPRLEQRLKAQAMHEPDIADRIVDGAEAVWVADLVRALPARQRSVIEHRAQNLAPSDIAMRLGLSYKGVESLTSRARQSVRMSMASTLNVALVLLASTAAAVRRGSRVTAPVATASALAVTIGAVAPLLHERSTPEMRTLTSTPHETRLATPRTLLATDADAFASPVAAPPQLRVAEATTIGQPETVGQPVATVPGQRLPVGEHEDVEIRRDKRNGSFVADALQCIADGPEVTTSHVGCRQPGQQPQDRRGVALP